MGNLEAGAGIQISGTTTKTISTNLNQGTGIALSTQPNGSITITSTGGTGVAGVASISDGTNAVDGAVQLLSGGGLGIVSAQGDTPSITLTAAGVSTTGTFGSGIITTPVGADPQELALSLESIDGSITFQKSGTDTFINLAVANPTPTIGNGLDVNAGVLNALGSSGVIGGGIFASATSTTGPQILAVDLMPDETIILTPSTTDTAVSIKTNISAGAGVGQTGGNTFNAIDPNITARSVVVVCFTDAPADMRLMSITPSAGVAQVITIGAIGGTKMNYISYNLP